MKGKSYLVTGASRGVGLCLVKELMHKEEEPIIFAAARLPEKYEELQELAKANGRVHIIRLDLTDVQTIKARKLDLVECPAELNRPFPHSAFLNHLKFKFSKIRNIFSTQASCARLRKSECLLDKRCEECWRRLHSFCLLSPSTCMQCALI